MEPKKTNKFNYDEISFKNDQVRPYTETINFINAKKICICNNYNEHKTLTCFKCKTKFHNCLKVLNNRPQIGFECLSCLAKVMDLVYEPQVILLETYYKTQNIFDRANIINFEFNLRYQDTKFPVDIRGLKGSKIQIAWPMAGEFIVNDFKQTLNSLKPLKSNSNRKNRKEDYYQVDPKYLKQGKNVLTFKIPRLQKKIVLEKYKYEESGVYFIAIYSVKVLKTNDVLNITLKERRFEKQQTLELFKQGDEDVPTEKQKVRLIDPYTSQRIKFPVRGRYCTHLATVCLVSYVEFQRNSRSWKCPICSIQSNSFLNEPYLDVWMHEILKDNLTGENVFINPDGSYEWEATKVTIESLDSDDEDDINRPQKLPSIVEQEQAVIAQLQIFDIESNNHSSNNHPRQIDLIDYDEFRENQNAQNDFWNHQQVSEHSEGEIGSGHQGNQNQQTKSNNNFDARSVVGEPIIEEFAEIGQPESDSNSEFDFPFNNNDYVPSSKLQNVKVSQTPIQPQKKDLSKAPQIYSMPLQTKLKQDYQKRIQTNVSQQHLSADMINKMNILRQKIIQKTNQSTDAKTLPTQTQKKQPSQVHQTPKTQNIAKDKIIGDKRFIHRPTYIQTLEQKPNSFGLNQSQSLKTLHPNLQRKKIEQSQERMNKSEPKVQQGLGRFFPLPIQMQKKAEPIQKKIEQSKKPTSVQKTLQLKTDKKESTVVQKPKLPKMRTIKCLDCPPITLTKFSKDYCRIPNPTLFRRINQDLKAIFESIL